MLGLRDIKIYEEEPYDILAPLARGGMAEVFIARGPSGLVAVKKILPSLASAKKNLEMFLDEAHITARFDHPNVVKIYEHGRVGKEHFIVMEYLEGESFGYTVARTFKSGQTMPPHLIAAIVAQVCDGLHYAHSLPDEEGHPLSIIHRDISPQNIIVLFSGLVKLLDFGIARARFRVHQTRTGVTKGKYAYMSPEQCLGRKLDGRSDIFSLGIVAWEVLSGRRLFKRKREMDTMKAVVDCRIPAIGKYRPGVPDDLQSIVGRALEKDPKMRYETAGEMAEELRAFLAQNGAPADQDAIAAFLPRVLQDRMDAKTQLLAQLDQYGGESEALAVLKPDSEAQFPSSPSGEVSAPSGEGGVAEQADGADTEPPVDETQSDGQSVESPEYSSPFTTRFDDIDQGEDDFDDESGRSTTLATAVERLTRKDEDSALSQEEQGPEPDDSCLEENDLDELETGVHSDPRIPGRTKSQPNEVAADLPWEEDDGVGTTTRASDRKSGKNASGRRSSSAKRKALAARARNARRARKAAGEGKDSAAKGSSGAKKIPMSLLVGVAVLLVGLAVVVLWPSGGSKSSDSTGPEGEVTKHHSDPGSGKKPPVDSDDKKGSQRGGIARVQIDSSPSACVVLLDGKKIESRTPIQGLQVSAGQSHRISVLCQGHPPETRDIKPEANERVGLVFRLGQDGSDGPPAAVAGSSKKRKRVKKPDRAAVGRLRLNTNPWTEVFEGERRLGITPLLGQKMPPGTHVLKLVNKEMGISTSIQVTIRSGRTTKLFKRLK